MTNLKSMTKYIMTSLRSATSANDLGREAFEEWCESKGFDRKDWYNTIKWEAWQAARNQLSEENERLREALTEILHVHGTDDDGEPISPGENKATRNVIRRLHELETASREGE